jgi:hypothetical protein
MAALQTPGLDAVIESVVKDTAGGTGNAKGMFQKEMISIVRAGRRLGLD